MFLTAHSSAALALSTTPLPAYLLYPLALLSHYLLDIIPHGDEGLIPENLPHKKKIKTFLAIALTDGIGVLLVLSLFFFIKTDVSITRSLVAVFLACLPDGLQFIEYSTHGKFKLIHRHQQIHTYIHNILHTTVPFYTGIIIQLIAMAIFITWW